MRYIGEDDKIVTESLYTFAAKVTLAEGVDSAASNRANRIWFAGLATIVLGVAAAASLGLLVFATFRHLSISTHVSLPGLATLMLSLALIASVAFLASTDARPGVATLRFIGGVFGGMVGTHGLKRHIRTEAASRMPMARTLRVA